MESGQCWRQAPALAGELWLRRGITTGDRPEAARASSRPLGCALGFLAAVAVASLGHSASPALGSASAPALASAGQAGGGGNPANAGPPSGTRDGLIGATSTGATTITVIIPSRIQVGGFTDIRLGIYSGGALTGSSPACVSRNGPGSYSVAMTSANGRFVLASATQAASIPYTVAWGASNVAYSRAAGPFPTDNTSLAGCTPVGNRLTVTVPAAAMEVAQPGAYADTLSVMVTPL